MRIHNNEKGFTYIDVMIALLVLMIGVLGLAGAIYAAVVRSRDAEQQQKAKQYANSTLESIFSARDIDKLGWDSINHKDTCTGGTDDGVFLCGKNALYPEAGTDGVLGTSDDSGTAVKGFEREIVITDIDDTDRPKANGFPIMFRTVKVSIHYQVAGFTRTENTSTVITNY
jgi:type II secretory pathway pseudopilin PulG